MLQSKGLGNKKRNRFSALMEDTMADNERQEAQKSKAKKELERIPLDLIKIEKNIRSSYSDEAMLELSESLKANGLLQPISVTETGDGYTVLYGHRRFLAAEKVGWTEIDCIVQKGFAGDIERIIAQIAENEDREDVTPADKEASVLALEETYHLAVEDICTRFGKSRGWYSQIKTAHRFRQQYGALFEEAQIPLYTKEAYLMKDASEEQVKQAIESLKNKDGVKADVVSELSNLTKKGKRGRKPKGENQPQESTKIPLTGDTHADFNIGDEPMSLNISTRIVLNKDRSFSLKVTGLGTEKGQRFVELIESALVSVFEQDGFNKV